VAWRHYGGGRPTPSFHRTTAGERFVPVLASFDEPFGRVVRGPAPALDAHQVEDRTGQFHQWERLEQDMTHTQFGGPLTHLDGGVGGDQHEVALPVLAYSLQNLKPSMSGKR
jgi:hypothetical protein